MHNQNSLIIAHRGESYDAPENTLASINLAWKRDAEAVEIDVRLTKDEKIIVIHDKTTLRTGKKFKKILTSNYDELKIIDVGRFKGAKWKNEKIPLLDEVIDTIPDNKILFIEIKSDSRIIDHLKKLLLHKPVTPDQIKFIGFNLDIMKLVKESLPEYESFWIIEGKSYRKKSNLEEIISKCKKAKLEGLDVEARKYLNSEIIRSVHDSNLKIYTWTVDDLTKAKRLYSYGIDGITTNRASWLRMKLYNQLIT
jgi:glycerophosphoryl diester phosphodiesterase